ncbi:MAG: riboflavin biosynthesis protein RibF [Oscillospiraceae bacterium]|jgi:riboflavin kinase/FMN adenylyltransferase|nr:riboflavin biosynthesis protein RibF [Oscillospiraceae bacterium]
MKNQPRVIALGFFDGVHLGHGALLHTVAQRAKALNALPSAFTFDRSPTAALTGRVISLLTGVEDRRRLMEELYGIREVVVAPFDVMRDMDWRDFVADYLQTHLRAAHVVAGHDFRFGRGGEGTPERLREQCGALGMGCDIIPKVELDGITVSSTHIRALVEAGELERAARFLGHPHILSGPVVHGSELGRTLGTPTANLLVPDGVIAPAFGVYASRVLLPDGDSRLAVTNVGVRPTVNAGLAGVTVEPWILDFQGDLYGQTICLELHKQLRPERKFSGVDQLRAAILENAAQTRSYFAAKGPVQ